MQTVDPSEQLDADWYSLGDSSCVLTLNTGMTYDLVKHKTRDARDAFIGFSLTYVDHRDTSSDQVNVYAIIYSVVFKCSTLNSYTCT